MALKPRRMLLSWGRTVLSLPPTTATLKSHILAVVEGFSPNHNGFEIRHIYVNTGLYNALFNSNDAWQKQ